MRQRTHRVALFLGVIGSVLLAGVASAAPGQNEWSSGTGSFQDPCTGEIVDNTFNVHFMGTDGAPLHFNLQLVGIGETTGASYVGNSEDNESLHLLPDGNYMAGQVTNVKVVSKGGTPNLSVATVHFHLVVDQNLNYVSGFFDSTGNVCQGG
jgi:hypothetical protein